MTAGNAVRQVRKSKRRGEVRKYMGESRATRSRLCGVGFVWVVVFGFRFSLTAAS